MFYYMRDFTLRKEMVCILPGFPAVNISLLLPFRNNSINLSTRIDTQYIRLLTTEEGLT